MNTRFASFALLTLLLVPAVLFAQMPTTLDSYLYLSLTETAFYSNNDPEHVIWFYTGDTLDGPVRSNDYISIKNDPVFLEQVYSTMDEFRENNAYPRFDYEPIFQVEEFAFDFDMEAIRETTVNNETFFSNYFNGNPVRTHIEAISAMWEITQWPEGTEYNEENIVNTVTFNYNDERVIFVEGNLDILGERVEGNTTIVCSGEVRIIDNLMYRGTIVGASGLTISEDNTSTLGLIAAGDILVGNTEANGRGNGGNNGSSDNHSNKHCVITASLVSLNGSFAFENKNFPPGTDRYDGYYWCDPDGEHRNETDMRGTIYFLGSLAHYRRDFTRMTNCSRTGYEKCFRYDHRLEELTPPLFGGPLGIKEDSGLATSLPLTHQLRSAYPNPFNSSFNLDMTLIKRDQVRIRLVNVLGQEVFAQDFGWMNNGDQRFTINLTDHPAGLYFAQVSTSSGFSETQKVIYMK